jgi:uncharacterized membrane protein (DUF4010 family)
VTFTFARLSRSEPSSARELGFGAIAANAVLFPRVLIAVLVLNRSLALPVLPYLVVPFVIAVLVAVTGLRRAPAEEQSAAAPAAHPLQLGAALQMAVLFQVVLMAVYLAHDFWGDAGVLGSAAVLGLTDVDALTVTMARGEATTGDLALSALAIGIGVLSNTALKSAIALSIGGGSFRRIAGGTLALMLVAGGAAAAWLAMRLL